MKVPTGIIIIVLFLSPVLLSYNTGLTIVSNEDTTLSSFQGWLSDWEIRKSHTMEGSLGAGNNYPVRLTVHYGSGIDSGADVYCDTLCRTDFGDIRFTDDDGTTLLDYWTESFVASDHAIFWVEIADNLNTSQDIYVYFGNPVATSVSNGTATFQFFDDFESGSLDKWDYVNDWSISTTYQTDGVYGVYSVGGSSQPALRHDMNQTESFLISIDARTFDNFNTFPYLMSSDAGSCYPCTFGWTNALYHTGSYSNWPQNSTLAYNTWYAMQIGFDMNSGKIRGWKNGLYMGEVDFASTTGATPTNVTAFRPAGGTQTTRHLALDNVYIRKWIPLEPSHGEWGPLEFEPPSINSPSDFTYEAGTTNNFVVWSPLSSFPASYKVFLDNSLYENETWDGSEVSISVDGLSLGTYNLTIQVFDTHNNYVTDTVYVVVEDTTNPILSHPPDMTYNETSTGNTIQWAPTDLYPASYMIMLDNELLSSGAWNTSGESIQISIDGLSAGSYTYNLTVTDQSGNLAFDLVSVVVLPLPLFGDDLTVYILMIGGVAVVVIIGGIVCRSKKP
ncbi:MAG: DUF2341 domain-containing protein [Candidatus Thorarchaeota archaeon]|jgi:hypothetical protein